MGELIVIGGPTASGKTALSLAVAEAFNAEIISADGRQFYRGMDIGTAKPTPEEQARVPHHFIDSLNPDEDYNAGHFERDVIAFLDDYFQKKEVAVMVGGSGLYLRAVTEGFDDLPSTPPDVREHYSKKLKEEGLHSLQAELKQKDPVYYEKVDRQNHQRIQRALEVIAITGEPFSAMRRKEKKERPFGIHTLNLLPDRSVLYERIDARVDAMIAQGLEAEARKLLPFRDTNALQTVGYQEWFTHFDGDCTREEAIDKIKQHSRNYAKRQFTWFKKRSADLVQEEVEEDEAIRHLRSLLNV